MVSFTYLKCSALLTEIGLIANSCNFSLFVWFFLFLFLYQDQILSLQNVLWVKCEARINSLNFYKAPLFMVVVICMEKHIRQVQNKYKNVVYI